MINENDLLEPRKAYETILKDEIRKNAEDYFEDLVAKSGINTEANEQTMNLRDSYRKDEQEADKVRKAKQKTGGVLAAFGIILIILAVLACIVLNMLYSSVETWIYVVFGWVTPIIALAGGIALLIVKGVKINPVIKNQNSIIARLQAAQREQEAIGREQMRPLDAFYTWNMHLDVVNRTTPLIKLDKYFSFERLQYLEESFNYKHVESNDISVVHLLSGEILGNPFVVETLKVMNMGTCTYTGELTITYQVRVSNGGKDGGYHYETRTQVLHASITKPKPYYNYEKRLSYGCEAAPDLSFSRVPSGINTMDEKELKKYISAEKKKLEKIVEDEKNHAKFTALANDQFETLFHAWDRDNEVQFRLLFTPLAQKNYLDLIKNKEPYGDDFVIRKDKKLNTVVTNHSQYVDYVGDPNEFSTCSYKESKERFINFNETFFKSFYFDMATLLSIPLYQQYPTDEFIFRKVLPNNITPMEVEAVANAFSTDTFKPVECVTEQILKTAFVRPEGEADRINVTSYGYKTIPHLDYVGVMGKDGHLHQVPVHWLEYVKVKKTTPIEVIHKPLTRNELLKKRQSYQYQDFINNNVFNNKIIYSKEFFSFVVPGEQRTFNQNSFEALLSNIEEGE